MRRGGLGSLKKGISVLKPANGETISAAIMGILVLFGSEALTGKWNPTSVMKNQGAPVLQAQ